MVVAMAICGQAKAQVACEGCSSSEMFAKGQSLVTSVAFRKPHPPVYITNIQDGTVLKVMYAHNVDQNFNWENDTFRAWGISSPVETQVSQFISSLHAQMPPNGWITLSSVSLARSMTTAAAGQVPPSAYDAIASPSYDLVISSYVEGSMAGAINSYQQGASVIPILNGFSPAAVPLSARVKFADGTWARYIWKPETKLWTRVPGSARDNFGNIIPETIQDVTAGGYREYRFGQGSNSDMTQFTNRLSQMGISIGIGGGVGTNFKIGCSSAGNGPPICQLMIY